MGTSENKLKEFMKDEDKVLELTRMALDRNEGVVADDLDEAYETLKRDTYKLPPGKTGKLRILTIPDVRYEIRYREIFEAIEKQQKNVELLKAASVLDSNSILTGDICWSETPYLPIDVTNEIRERGIPLIITIKGMFWLESNAKFYDKCLNAIEVAHRLIFLSEHTRDRFSKVFPEHKNKSIVIPAYFHINPELNKVKLLTVTNFNYLKKIAGLIDLAHIINRIDNDNLEWTIIGTGKYKDMVTEFIDGLKDDRINLILECDHINLILKNSDIFIYCSYQDSQPSTVMEAMASGLPCVVNSGQGFENFVVDGETGYVCDLHMMKDGILSLIKDEKLRKQFGEKAIYLIETQFNLDKSTESYLGIIEECSIISPRE